MKAQLQRGFTLIELMIVVAIIGILAAVAIPMYSDYTQRAKASTGIAALASFKQAVAMCYQNEGRFDDCDAGANRIPAAITAPADGAEPAVNGLLSVGVTNGVISAQLQAVDTDGVEIDITLTPSDASGSNLSWTLACSDYGTDGADSRVDGCTEATPAEG